MWCSKLSKKFIFSRHYREDKKIEESLAIDCTHTGRKELEEEPNKFKAVKRYEKGELIVIYREYDDYFFVITAFWNNWGKKYEF